MVFKKSPLLLLLTPFPNYYNGIVKKEKKNIATGQQQKKTNKNRKHPDKLFK